MATTVAKESRWNVTRSSLEEMLEAIRKRDEKPKDVPPALPARPLSKAARLPSARKSLPNNFKIGEPAAAAAEFLPKGSDAGKKRDRDGEEADGGLANKLLKVKVVPPADSPYDGGICRIRLQRKNMDLDLEDGAGIEMDSPLANKEIRVWCQLPNGVWESGSIQSNSADEALVMLLDGNVVTVPMKKVSPANPEILDGVDDLIQLSYLNEPSVFHNLHSRYCYDKIYTKAGSVLVAMNPFKDDQLHNNDSIKGYRWKQMDGPHVYAVADTAFREMMRDEVNQSILISGESGAGKTETARMAMKYLVALGGGSEIEHKILQTNNILESFGNAKTSINQNSSRFGKLIDVHFSTDGKICGAMIETFLLEKTRVVQVAKGERSYHIFYQLCAGAPSFLKERLNLKTVGEYSYLKQSDCLTIDGVDDAQRFQMLTEALNILQISEEDQENAFSMLSSVLWLGNISFEVVDNALEVMTDEAVTSAAKLLGCNVEDLMLILSTCRIQVDDETVVEKLTLPQAVEKRDALAKSIYFCLFDWLVNKINTSLQLGRMETGRSISIVDITGFERAQKASFEQLSRNYANERLQQHFNRHLFKLEQEEYTHDGIDCTKVDFEDNQECLNLFEQKPCGLLSLLDEECSSQRPTGLTFTDKLKQHLSSNPCFKAETGGTFSVCHHAGEVSYDPSEFLLKSRDLLHSDSVELLSSCTSQLPQLFASNMLKASQKTASPLSELGCSDSQNQSAGSRLKDQLFKLMQKLENTAPHFIRCIKPNTKQLPGIFEKDIVLQQLRYCGILEVARISRSGYSTRVTHQQFARRYSFVLSQKVASGEQLSVSIAILQRFNVHPDMYQVGYTKLFLRTGQISALEAARRRFLQSVIEIQKFFRGHQDRRRFLERKRTSTPNSCLEESTMERGFDQHSAVIYLQSVIRGWLVRRKSCNMQNPVQMKIGSKGANTQLYERTPYMKEHEHDQALISVSELQKRVLNAETAMRQKEDENAMLRQQLKQFETRWSECEEKMKAMENIWQKKISSLQTSLTAAKNGFVADEAMVQSGRPDSSPLNHSYDSEDTNSGGTHTPELSTPIKSRSSDPTPGRGSSNGLNAVGHLVKEFDQQKQVFNDDARFLMNIRSGHQTNMSPYDDLRKLKKNFESWKKDFRVRLRETKSNLHKLGIVETTKHRKTWWAVMSSRRT